MICPECGSSNCQAISETTRTGYSLAKGCCGWLLLGGPLGLLCGLCGMGKTKSKIFWVCHNCGKRFQNGIKETEIVKVNPNLTYGQQNNQYIQADNSKGRRNEDIKFISDQDKRVLMDQNKIAYSQRIKKGVDYFLQNLLYLKMRTSLESRLIIAAPQDIQKNILCTTLIKNCCKSLDAVKSEFIYFCLETDVGKIDGFYGLVATTEGIYFRKGIANPKPTFISRDTILYYGIDVKAWRLVIGNEKINLAALSDNDFELIVLTLKGIYLP